MTQCGAASTQCSTHRPNQPEIVRSNLEVGRQLGQILSNIRPIKPDSGRIRSKFVRTTGHLPNTLLNQVGPNQLWLNPTPQSDRTLPSQDGPAHMSTEATLDWPEAAPKPDGVELVPNPVEPSPVSFKPAPALGQPRPHSLPTDSPAKIPVRSNRFKFGATTPKLLKTPLRQIGANQLRSTPTPKSGRTLPKLGPTRADVCRSASPKRGRPHPNLGRPSR